MFRQLLFFMAWILLDNAAAATELYAFGESPRSFGMGGVRTLGVGGEQADCILWNPAGLSYLKGFRWDVVNLGVGLNGTQTYQALQNIKGAGSGSGLAGLTPYYGIPLWVGGQGYSAIAVPYFGIAAFDNFYGKFKLHNPALPELDADYLNDYGVSLAGSLDFGGFSIGTAFKRIDRTGGPVTIGSDILAGGNSANLQNDFTNEGVGYGVDLGMMYRAPVPLNPTVSVSWQNIGKVTFQQTKGAAAPPMLDDDLTAGVSISADSTLAGFTTGIEYRHITDANEELGKKIHLGTEIELSILTVRGGFYQGYPTYGVGLDLFLFELNAALYTVETGAYPGQTPDQRFQVGLSSTLSFDPNFKLVDVGSSSRRKLKQRR
ncbi:MAG: hypothetical protein C5B49_02390 [Bdellovibrio sp.]|nr:MAG: hypothetical protein C5B49_02390 [Bdellovibrio sp.]